MGRVVVAILIECSYLRVVRPWVRAAVVACAPRPFVSRLVSSDPATTRFAHAFSSDCERRGETGWNERDHQC